MGVIWDIYTALSKVNTTSVTDSVITCIICVRKMLALDKRGLALESGEALDSSARKLF